MPEGELYKYAAYYGLDRAPYSMSAGFVESRGMRVFVLSMKGERPDDGWEPRGTVFFVHGFLLHSGFWFKHVAFLLESGYDLVMMDLPGHGLSDGITGDIDDFSRYGDALRALVRAAEGEFPKPWFAMGHSTGCSAWLDYLLDRDAGPFSRFVFLAPLVRNTMWFAARTGDVATHRDIPWLPAMDPDRPQDPEFRASMDADPIWPKLFPYRWPRALFRWNDALAWRTVPKVDLAILQGDSDDVVDWRWNLSFYRDRLPDVRIRMFEGIGHELLFDIRERIPEVQTAVLEELSRPLR
jgi:lysophospholipase